MNYFHSMGFNKSWEKYELLHVYGSNICIHIAEDPNRHSGTQGALILGI